MKKAVLIALFLLSPLAHAVSPFELPWMNHTDSGTIYKSADHVSGIFVVEAYFLNCPYCNDNAENVNELADKYKSDSRVQVLDVGIDTSDSQYKTWINKHRPNHPVLKDSQRRLISQLGTSGYPSTYVLDCKGNVLTKTSGAWNSQKLNQITNAIEKLLKQDCKAF